MSNHTKTMTPIHVLRLCTLVLPISIGLGACSTGSDGVVTRIGGTVITDAGTAGNVTGVQIMTYYERHRQLFTIPEKRVAKFASRTSRSAIDKLKREVESGKDLTSAAQRAVGEVTLTVSSPPNRRTPIEKAIYAAKPSVITNPTGMGTNYYLFKVVQIFPPTTQTLAQVEGTIRKQLVEEAQRRALAAFVKIWRAEWTAKTNCSAGYVVQKCRQYSGPRAPEDPF